MVKQLRIALDMRAVQTHKKTGIPNYMIHLVDQFAAIDDRNKYILFYNAMKSIKPYILEFENIRFKNVVTRIPNKVLEFCWDKISFPRIEVLTGELDVFHATHFIAPPVAKAKTVLTIHDLAFLKFPKLFTSAQGQQFSRLCKQSCHKSNTIISISASTKIDLVNLLAIPPEKITNIPLASREIFRPITKTEDSIDMAARYSLFDNYILFVGTIEPRKNPMRLIQAYAQLPDYIRNDFHLVLAGGRGWLCDGVYTEPQRLGLPEGSVKFLDYVPDEDLVYLMNGASVFVYPSLYEGFGLPPLEAMACGVPVISSNISSIPEVVGDAGILVDPYSVEELSNAIQRVLEDSTLAKELGQKGLERSRQFSWERTARETLKVYEMACALK